MQWKSLHRGQYANIDVRTQSRIIPLLQKNLENWIQILTGSQMEHRQQPKVQGGGRKKRKKKTKPHPSAMQLSSLQFLVMRGHSISQTGCCRSGLRRINKFIWRKLAQHLPTICQFSSSSFPMNQILFSTWRKIFNFLIMLILGKICIPELQKAF